MKQAEIDFCERWCELRGADGEVWGGEYLYPERVGLPVVAVARQSSSGVTLFDLTPRGADLVASYEAALEQGLPIVADDAVLSGMDLGRADIDQTVIITTCPECEGSGEIGIPIEYGALGGILRVWPARCSTCKGARVVEAEPFVNVGRPLDEWAQLTRDLGERLAAHGGEIEVRDNGAKITRRGRATLATTRGLLFVRSGDHLFGPDLVDRYLNHCYSFNGRWWARAVPGEPSARRDADRNAPASVGVGRA